MTDWLAAYYGHSDPISSGNETARAEKRLSLRQRYGSFARTQA
jgi:hypothetical protein